MNDTIDDDVHLMLALPRSPHWPTRERSHLLIQPRCLVCLRDDSETNLTVHHRYPFAYLVGMERPDLELDERNLFTICDDHHLTVGHLNYFGSYNPRFEHFVAMCRGLTLPQIRSAHEFVSAVQSRPKPFAKMDYWERSALLTEINRNMPKVSA